MYLTTLCYIERDGQWLMMNRIKKQRDENAGKWIGVGGHLEEGESPEECIVREVREETGMTLKSPRLRGIITFILPKWGNEIAFLYTGEADGEPTADCPEGILRWIGIDQVYDLPLWEGDRVFLPLLQTRQDCFSLKLIYDPDGKLTGCLLDGIDITKEALGENE
ncbi:MAG: 8-oxo-dGTP diphosphatase [Clostridia bacterium]|nr:8-oxo-dGTP diphosphatase [Clostridia bacterium]